ncbi:hypothetical protein SERLA73DRAFT_46722 [Serpula lacrymans var. lacrymans S7.3]|uniref:Uncharacterized protein n=1 Tax=Serpula lacrymans var. lacrymans (strain S7.3) TaxID=936435 RepID=F8PJQ4_SERL3|nr:hypothetical protein SERLA73DRAFT_46722 [Serpula lacrymans var. lacrymans S7.3]
MTRRVCLIIAEFTLLVTLGRSERRAIVVRVHPAGTSAASHRITLAIYISQTTCLVLLILTWHPSLSLKGLLLHYLKTFFILTLVSFLSFGHVTTAIVSSTWLLVWQTILVGRFRRRAGIDYPQLYAETAEMKASKDATLFNCAQRAHANTLETLPVVLLSTLVASLKNPYYASYACGLWVFARILYTLGYTTGDPAKVLPFLYTRLSRHLTPHFAEEHSRRWSGLLGYVG